MCPTVRVFPRRDFEQIACAISGADERASVRTLGKKEILAPLADGEYWLTDEGLEFVTF